MPGRWHLMPELFWGDEPTGNLDEETAEEIIEIFKECAHQMNKCVVIVTHSSDFAKQADVVLKLKKGVVTIQNAVQDSTL